jgi:hypothetical protein
VAALQSSGKEAPRKEGKKRLPMVDGQVRLMGERERERERKKRC